MPNPTGTVRDIARRGQVWVIDPRRTETARLATGHPALRPRTDHAVPAYLVADVAETELTRPCGELAGLAKIDDSIRRGAVSQPE